VGLQAYLSSALWTGTEEARSLLEGRLSHYHWQATLPSPRIARIPSVMGRLFKGEYASYRRGAFDAMRDLFQPAG
jgi:hypothetical protein